MENIKNPLLTTAQAAAYLGLKTSYLHKLMMHRAIPYYKPNNKLCFFAQADLDHWLTGNRLHRRRKSSSRLSSICPRNAEKANEHDATYLHPSTSFIEVHVTCILSGMSVVQFYAVPCSIFVGTEYRPIDTINQLKYGDFGNVFLTPCVSDAINPVFRHKSPS